MGGNQALKEQNNLLKKEIEELKIEKQNQSVKFENMIMNLENKREKDFEKLTTYYDNMKESLKKENDAILNRFKETKKQYKLMIMQTSSLINIMFRNVYDPNGEMKKELDKLLETQTRLLKEDEDFF